MTPVPLPVPAARRRFPLVALLGTLLVSVPFFVLGGWLLDRPALTELHCAAGGTECTLVRSGWVTRGPEVRLKTAALASARVDRLRGSRGIEYRPLVESGGEKQYLTFRWAKTPDAAEGLVDRLHAQARDPRGELTFRDDGRRATAGVGGSFTVAGLGALGVSCFFVMRHRRRT